MNPEIRKIYNEIKDYIENGEYGWKLKKDVPKEIQEKFQYMQSLPDDEDALSEKEIEELKKTLNNK